MLRPASLVLTTALLTCLSIPNAHALVEPQLTGQVTDAMTGDPISGAAVQVILPFLDAQFDYVTDAEGRYIDTDVAVDPQPRSHVFLGPAFPGPVSGAAAVRYSRVGEFSLFDFRGRRVAGVELTGGTSTLTLPRTLASGIYVAALRSHGVVVDARTIVVQDGLDRLTLEFTEKIAAPESGSRGPEDTHQKDESWGDYYCFINIQKAGYIPASTWTLVWPNAESARSFRLAPIPTEPRIHGVLVDQTCSQALGSATIAVGTNDGSVYRHQVAVNGEFDFTPPLAGNPDVRVWLEDLDGFEGDTFTLCKRNQPSAIGVTASCVSVCEPDTLTLPLHELAYPGGHYLLTLETAMAENDTMLNMLTRAGYGRHGIEKWQQPHIRLMKQLNTYRDDTQPIPGDVSHQIDLAMDWLAHAYGTDLGLHYIETAVRDSFWGPGNALDRDLLYGTAMFSFDHLNTIPLNIRFPPIAVSFDDSYPFTILGTALCVPGQDSAWLYILEITEALGIGDYRQGSNHWAFSYQSSTEFRFNPLGETIWAILHTYRGGADFRCEEF